VDHRVVHVGDPAVVVELIVIPIPAVITATDVTVAVIHTTVVADITAPITTMPSIAVTVITPIPGCP
jgi:hypothetical protein